MVDASQYVCPDGQVLRAGVTGDQRLLRLTVAGRTYTLRQQQDGYSNGHFTARRDDLFLRLHRAGDLLPRHCRLVIDASHPGP
ncbi:MAG: hypothetical protein K0S46_2620 [Moraxellaceae bacterium]|jgi:hypothetical protein|nr:hypothetical protein [Moraxellaceae bacterium]